ncbi:glycosyl hydrolase family 28-related protein [Spirosoma flavum]|uniref:Glycosyl hydrolase family 28-related protein n=1 Tax=Spirosoma flavum TaxID=2048557 RepID=A0ABW6ALC4_9BACT
MKKILSLLLLVPSLLLGQNAKTVRVGAAGPTSLSVLVNVPVPPGGSSTVLPVSTDLHIFHIAKTADPGQPLFLQGAFPANATVNLTINEATPTYSLTIGPNQQLNSLNTFIPESYPMGLYGISVVANGAKSLTRYINRAEGHFTTSPDVYSGAPMELCGTNLLLPGFRPTIRFQPVGGGASLYAAFDQTNSFDKRINFRAPLGLTVGQAYQALVSNGAGGALGESLVGTTVTAITPGLDVFNIGQAWGAKYALLFGNVYNIMNDPRLTLHAVGDGVTNDKPAIDAAITIINASTNGGVLLFPNGTYKIIIAGSGSGGVGITFKSKVVLMGTSKDSTILSFGYSGTQTFDLFKRDDGVNTNGIMNFTIQNVDPASEAWYTGVMRGSEMFWKNVRFNMYKADNIAFWGAVKLALLDCEITQTLNKDIHGPLSLTGATYVVAKRNVFRFVGGPGIDQTKYVLWEQNRLLKDVSFGHVTSPNVKTYHVMTADFTQFALVHKNTFETVSGNKPANPPFWINDLEAVISEDPDLIDQDQGSVSSATPTTLTDNSKSWSGAFQMNPVVTIYGGTGAGQTKPITSRTANTLTVGSAWSVVPDATSKYSVFNWTIKDVSFTFNVMERMQRGFTMYFSAAENVNFEYNTLNNSGAIDLNPAHIQRTGFIQVNPQYDFRVKGNELSSLTDPRNGNFIGVHTSQTSAGALTGYLAINTQIIGNKVTGGIPNFTTQIDDFYPNGFLSYHFPPSSGYVATQPAILGTTLWGNVGVNLDNALNTNSGNDQMILKQNYFQYNVTSGQNDNLRSIGNSLRTTNLN